MNTNVLCLNNNSAFQGRQFQPQRTQQKYVCKKHQDSEKEGIRREQRGGRERTVILTKEQNGFLRVMEDVVW